MLEEYGYRPVQPLSGTSFRVPHDADLAPLGVFDLLFLPTSSGSNRS